jgi:hypothetical protein
MYEGKVSKKLGELIHRYHERFRGDLRDGFSLFETELNHDALVARLERALSEGIPYDPRAEEWDEETRRQVESGEIIL